MVHMSRISHITSGRGVNFWCSYSFVDVIKEFYENNSAAVRYFRSHNVLPIVTNTSVSCGHQWVNVYKFSALRIGEVMFSGVFTCLL